MTPSSPSRVPQLLLIAVMSLIPLRESAWIRLFGKPAPPNPPNIIRAPSGISETASSSELTIFRFISTRGAGLMLPVDCSRPPQIPQPRTPGRQNRKRERITVPSSPGWGAGLSLQPDGIALVGELRNNGHAFTWGVVLGHLDFALAPREFPAIRSSYDPNLPEEVGVAHTVEHELGGLRGQGQRALHRQNDGTRAATIEQQRIRRLCHWLNVVSSRGVHRVANDEVKGNVRLDVKCLGLRGR